METSGLWNALDKVAGVNTQIALARMDGRADIYLKAAESFWGKIPPERAKLSALMAAKDYRGLSLSAHALKSMLAAIGAMPLSEMAARLEKAFAATPPRKPNEEIPSNGFLDEVSAGRHGDGRVYALSEKIPGDEMLEDENVFNTGVEIFPLFMDGLARLHDALSLIFPLAYEEITTLNGKSTAPERKSAVLERESIIPDHPAGPEIRPASISMSPSFLAEKINDALSAVDDLDGDRALAALQNLTPRAGRETPAPWLETARRCIEDYDFESAAEILLRALHQTNAQGVIDIILSR